MSKWVFYTLLLAVAFFVFINPPQSFAHFSYIPRPEERFVNASAVFIGKVLKVYPGLGSYDYAEIEVHKSFKGIDTLKVFISSSYNDIYGSSFDFQPGYQYLIYADGSPDSLSISGNPIPVSEVSPEVLESLGNPNILLEDKFVFNPFYKDIAYALAFFVVILSTAVIIVKKVSGTLKRDI